MMSPPRFSRLFRLLQHLEPRYSSSILGPGPCAGNPSSTPPLLSIVPIQSCTGGAVVRNVSLEQLNEKEWSEIHKAFLDYGFLVFPEQHDLTSSGQTAFAKRFGKLEFTNLPVTNTKKDGTLVPETHSSYHATLTTEAWHCDSSFKPQSSKVAMLFSEVPPKSGGGETEFCDMRAAYDALDQAMKDKIEGLQAYHSIRYSTFRRTGFENFDAKTSTYLRPLVKIHPETGRKSLFTPSHAFGIPGLELDESEKLLDGLVDFAAQAPRTYTHFWEVGDFVVWDNRCFLHRKRPSNVNEEQRRLRGTRVAGDPESESALPAGHGLEKVTMQLERVREMQQWIGSSKRLR